MTRPDIQLLEYLHSDLVDDIGGERGMLLPHDPIGWGVPAPSDMARSDAMGYLLAFVRSCELGRPMRYLYDAARDVVRAHATIADEMEPVFARCRVWAQAAYDEARTAPLQEAA